MIRNSTKYVSYKDLKRVCAGLKEIYTEGAARDALEAFGGAWDGRYPMTYRPWYEHRGDPYE
jgi:transposase-like protein